MKFSRRAKGIIFGSAALLILLATTASACSGSTPTTNATESNQAQAGINLILQNLPVPVFAAPQLRKNLIEVEAIQSLGTPTTSFFFPEGATLVNGKYDEPPFKTCASQGEPIHATDELSNPQQVVGTGNNNAVTVPQMDPNGIYAGDSAGTYVLCVTPSGGLSMDYWEGPVETESGTAVWNAATGTITDVGPSQLPVCTLTKAAAGDGTGMTAGTPYFHCVKA